MIFMPRKVRFYLFLSLSFFCLLASLLLTLRQVDRYNASLRLFPSGTSIGGIPVGNLTEQAAGARLAQAFQQTPVELQIDGSPVQINPQDAGLQFNLDGILYAPRQILAGRAYWPGFWDFLMNRLSAGFAAPLACAVSEDHLHTYLQEQIAPRYNYPPSAVQPIPADVLFKPGHSGTVLDLDQVEPAIRTALCSASARVVAISTTQTGVLPPSLTMLEPVFESITQVSGFDGIIELYFQDLKSGKEINFAYNQGQPIKPEVAFTGASTIKIPVMISAYKRLDGPPPDDLRHQLELMIDLSDNGSTDEVMQRVLDEHIAPVEVTQDMQALGIENTFLAGFFYPGAPLLNRYQTPANQRTDISTDPDIYNQTTAPDMGRLLAYINQCAESASGPLIEKFTGQITQAECQEMVGLLAKNRKGLLIEAGLPEGTRLAHKYGWVTDANDGLMHTASDAAAVFTPGGNFILTIYLYHPVQLQWDDAQRLVARLATAADNFYNHWK